MFVQVHRYPTKPLWNEIAGFERELGRVFDSFLTPQSNAGNVPAIDVVEQGSETVLLAELPGVSKEDVQISLENNILSIKGTRKNNALPEKANWLRNEIRSGDFSRSVRLPKGINPEKITAEITNGVLKITLPKADELKPREIRVQ